MNETEFHVWAKYAFIFVFGNQSWTFAMVIYGPTAYEITVELNRTVQRAANCRDSVYKRYRKIFFDVSRQKALTCILNTITDINK